MRWTPENRSRGGGGVEHDTRRRRHRSSPEKPLSIFHWKGTCVGATSAHYVTDKEWNYFMLYLYTNMVKVEPYFEKFDKIYWTSRVQPTLKQLDHMCEHGLKGGPDIPMWFQQHVIYLFVLFLS
jgi:hypothetical protein